MFSSSSIVSIWTLPRDDEVQTKSGQLPTGSIFCKTIQFVMKNKFCWKYSESDRLTYEGYLHQLKNLTCKDMLIGKHCLHLLWKTRKDSRVKKNKLNLKYTNKINQLMGRKWSFLDSGKYANWRKKFELIFFCDEFQSDNPILESKKVMGWSLAKLKKKILFQSADFVWRHVQNFSQIYSFSNTKNLPSDLRTTCALHVSTCNTLVRKHHVFFCGNL